MANIKVNITYKNGDTELRFITSNSLTCADVEHNLAISDPMFSEIESFQVSYTEEFKQKVFQDEIRAILKRQGE